MNWDWAWLLLIGYLVGSQGTLILLKRSPQYRNHCRLRLASDAKKTKKEP